MTAKISFPHFLCRGFWITKKKHCPVPSDLLTPGKKQVNH